MPPVASVFYYSSRQAAVSKTFIFSTILNGAKSKGKRAVMAVRGRSLVDQASRRLEEMSVDHSVFMAGDKRFDSTKQIQICSIDTLRSRNLYPPADIVIIDEAHFATSQSFKNFLTVYSDAYWLSVTATPWVRGGLKHLADKIIYPISIEELTAQGYLVPARYYVPTAFDTSKIKIVSGEFAEDAALVEFKKQAVYGDVIRNYLKHCVGQPTFVFCINLAHAHEMQTYFLAEKINAVVITADTSLDERKFLLDNIENHVIISVGTMTTGVDVPSLRNIILCRPTKSKNLYVQMLGRGTRPFAGKEYFSVYDHVGNVVEHGFLIDEKQADLDGPEKKKKSTGASTAPQQKTCPACFAVVKRHLRVCHCGHVFVNLVELPKEYDGELIELNLDVRSRMKIRAKFFTYNAWRNGHKVGTIYYRLLDEFGPERVREYWQVYRAAKKEYESWLDGSASAPCTFAAAKAEREQWH